MRNSRNKVAKQQLSALNNVAARSIQATVNEKPVAPIIDRANEFDWGLVVNESGSKGQSDRSGINLIVSSSYEKNRGTGKITLSLSDDLLAKMHWRIGDKVSIGFARRNGQDVVGIKLDPTKDRTISAQTKSNNDSSKTGIVSIPVLDTLPVLPVKYTRLENADFDFSIPGVFVFAYPQNAEVNAG